MKEFIERIRVIRLALLIILVIGVLTLIFTGGGNRVIVVLVVGFAVTVLAGLDEIVEAIHDSLPNRTGVNISLDECIYRAVMKDSEKAMLDKMIAKFEKEFAQKEAPKAQAPGTEHSSKPEHSQRGDEAVHRPLSEAPEDGTPVYLHTQGESKNIVPTPYAKEYHGTALREGRIFATKEDALVYLYGWHYSTLKAEGEIGRGTLPSEYQD